METTALVGALEAWDVPGPWQMDALARGTNNSVFRAESPAGSYVVAVCGNHADVGRLRFEHTVLGRLADAGLPFAVPAPIRTKDGDTFVRVVSADGSEALATLRPRITGEEPKRENLAQAVAAGEALALVDEALREIGEVGGERAVSWRSYGDLDHCHSLVPDPLAAIRELPVAKEARRRLASQYVHLKERIPGIYATLPQQLAHEDFDTSNVLMEEERVTGVLDFEFCTRDVRVMDLTVALSWWPVDQLGTGNEWPIIEAFTRGYARHVTLSAKEIAALPVLYELRGLTSLIHRLGRYRQGLSSLEAVRWRAEAALMREDWLRANGERFVETVSKANASRERERKDTHDAE